MTDPDERAAPPSAGGSYDELEYCANCGAKLPENEWCPSIVDDDTDGPPIIRSFCDEACLEAWRAEGENATDDR